MADCLWAAAVSGLFTDPSKWTASAVPGAADNAVFDTSAATQYVVTSPTFESVASIQTSAAVKLDMKAGAFLTANGTGGGVSAGTIDIGNGALWRTGGTVTNSGAIDLGGQTKRSALVVDSGGATLDGGGAVAMSNFAGNVIEGQSAGATLTNVDDIISGSGAIGATKLNLINDAAAAINADRSAGMIINMGVGVLVNAGLIEVTGAGRLSIVGTTVDDTQGGTLSAGNGKLLVLNGDTVEGGTIQSTGLGLVLPKGHQTVLDGRRQPLTLVGIGLPRTGAVVRVCGGASVTIEGVINNTSALEVHTASGVPRLNSIVVGAAGATLTGGGQLNMNTQDVTLDVVVGASPSATLVNDNNRILGAGSLGDGKMVLVNEAAGVVNSGGALSLIIDTGAKTIFNAGLIAGSGPGGTIIKSAVNNAGLLRAYDGSLVVDGPVSGSGSATVNGGRLDFISSFTQNVAFTGKTGMLELADSQAFAGTISRFSASGATTLDLGGIVFEAGTITASYSGGAYGGILTVISGSETARIHFKGDYAGVDWSLSNDGAGGADITAHSSAARTAPTSEFGASAASRVFIQAMAGVGSTAAVLAAPVAGALRSLPSFVAAPATAPHLV